MDATDVLKAIDDAFRIGLALLLIGLLFGLGLMFAISPPTETTFEDDAFTIIETSDGYQEAVLYSVEYRQQGHLEEGQRRRAMIEMDEVSACTNSRLDSQASDMTSDEWNSTDRQELVDAGDCTTDHTSVTVYNESVLSDA